MSKQWVLCGGGKLCKDRDHRDWADTGAMVLMFWLLRGYLVSCIRMAHKSLSIVQARHWFLGHACWRLGMLSLSIFLILMARSLLALKAQARQRHLIAHPDLMGICQLHGHSQLQLLDIQQPSSAQSSAELGPFPLTNLWRAAPCKLESRLLWFLCPSQMNSQDDWVGYGLINCWDIK